jgi:Tol biopolymer transport system component
VRISILSWLHRSRPVLYYPMRTGTRLFQQMQDALPRAIASSAPLVVFSLLSLLVFGCGNEPKVVPHEGAYGIYVLNLGTEDVRLVYSAPREIQTSSLRPTSDGGRLLFAQKVDGDSNEHFELCTVGSDGAGFQRLTHNSYRDVYPAWSPDNTRIAFLSFRRSDLDIYVMNADGTGDTLLYDSGFHDGDVDWVGGSIVFTSGFRIWKMHEDGTSAVPVTNPANAGQWGSANLPIGDYDPKLTPDGTKIVFERLEDPSTTHGRYNLFTVDTSGAGETRLTSNGYAQGLPSWSHSGTKLVYVVAAIEGEGAYDIYTMNADGTGNRKVTPDYFPSGFLCHAPVFAPGDSELFFIGQWWE